VLEGGRVGRFDAQQDKGSAVALAEQAGATGEFFLRPDRAGCPDPRTGDDLFEIDPKARMALLISGLAVVTVIDADDREISRIHHRYRRQRADILPAAAPAP
jgi:hypothetical protein